MDRMRIDAHHHLWDLAAVSYPWLEAKGEVRFFGDPTPIQRNYELPEFRQDTSVGGFAASVHIQVGAADPLDEARWVQAVADANPDWPLRQVAFCDLTASDVEAQLNRLQTLSTVVGVRQIIGRAPGEDASTGTQALLNSPGFLRGLEIAAERGLRFDLQLLPELMAAAGAAFAKVPDLPVALCHAGSPHDRSPAGLNAYAENLRNMSTLPNLVCKISGLGMFDHDWSASSVRPIFETCLDQFGPKRLMFGSNFPVDSLSSTYAELYERHGDLTKELSAADQVSFWGENAARFYGFA